MLKKWIAALLSAAAVLTVSACGNGQQAGSAESTPKIQTESKTASQTAGKLKVSVTFNAMKEFVEAVGKDKVEIATIIPDGMEPHDFEPKAQDLAGLSTAGVFVYNGFGMEAWAEQAVKSANNPNLIAVEASKGAEPIRSTDPEAAKENGQYDPHIWLSLKGAETEAKNIRDALIKADPANRADYEKNCGGFIAQLEDLYNKYQNKFQPLQSKSFVTGHAAFAYLCRDFGLKQNSVEDVFAEGEPSARQMVELVKYCQENRVKTVFAEEMASPEVSKVLAQEVGAKVETIYTMESGEDDKSYLERAEDNLSKIYDSLK